MAQDFTLMQLRSFVTVAETRNFRAAAARLHISQPPLTRHIQALERGLGVVLIERRSRGIELTPEGQALLPEARAVLALVDRALENVAKASSGASVILRVGYLEPTAFDLLPEVLHRFTAMLPHADVQLQELNSYEAVRRLEDRAIDVALVRPPVECTDMDITFLRNERLVAALPAGHRLAGQTIRLVDLRDEGFVSFAPTLGHGIHAAALHACAVAGFVPRVEQLATSVPGLMSIVAGGQAVGLVAHQFAATTRPGVAFSPLLDDAAVAPLAVARMRDHHSVAAETFISVCREVAQADIAS